nr:lysozyme inhibitor LprI family protein [Aureimonas sp. SA4125]
MGVDECLGQEQAAWDVLLNENYLSATAAAKEQDASLVEQSIEPGAAKSLVKAQRAWITFRDAECDRRFELYKDGTIRTNIASSCLLMLTATRALDLQ